MKDIIQFFNNVMMQLGHHDWVLVLRTGHDSYCWVDEKKIDIGMDYDGDVRQIVLHEIAHIDTAKYCNQKHNPRFWKHLEDLCHRFLGQELDKHQQGHKKWQSNGFYSVGYRT